MSNWLYACEFRSLWFKVVGRWVFKSPKVSQSLPKSPLPVSLINVAFELFEWYLVVNSGIIWLIVVRYLA